MKTQAFQLVFPEWYDERGEWEAQSKGWLQGVEMCFANGKVQSLFFYDPVRLAQDLQADTLQGKPFIAHLGLIVIPEITRDAILGVVEQLAEAGYFPVGTDPQKITPSNGSPREDAAVAV